MTAADHANTIRGIVSDYQDVISLPDVDRLLAALDALQAQAEAAQREADIQLGQKLAAQMTLKAVCDVLNLPMVSLGNGWTEATPKILARIETIVDEANRGFRERDAAEAELKEAYAKLERTNESFLATEAERDAAWVGSQIALCEEFVRAAKNDDTFGVEDIQAKLILLTQAES